MVTMPLYHFPLTCLVLIKIIKNSNRMISMASAISHGKSSNPRADDRKPPFPAFSL